MEQNDDKPQQKSPFPPVRKEPQPEPHPGLHVDGVIFKDGAIIEPVPFWVDPVSKVVTLHPDDPLSNEVSK